MGWPFCTLEIALRTKPPDNHQSSASTIKYSMAEETKSPTKISTVHTNISLHPRPKTEP